MKEQEGKEGEGRGEFKLSYLIQNPQERGEEVYPLIYISI